MIGSLTLAIELAHRRAALLRELASADAELAPLEARAQTLAGLESQGAAPPALIDAVIATLDVLRSGDVRHGVHLELLSVPGRNGSLAEGPADAQSLGMLARPLPGVAALRALRIEVRANYRHYPGLKDWLADLSALSLAIRRISLEDQRVLLTLELLGA